MNAVTVFQNSQVATAATAKDMKAQVQRVQEVMRAVMKKDVHYGVVPGTPKPSLWKPGAEVLCATFHIAPTYRVDDLSDNDCVRYRVTCVGTHQATGITMGEGMGEASSNEEKYKWRKAYNREYDATDEDRRRLKYGYDREKREEYDVRQIRTEPADVANTILKMACKRAQVAMTLNVVAASDCFTQDLEDMSDELRESVTGNHGGSATQRAPTKQPQSTSGNGGGGAGFASDKQVKLIRVKLDQAGRSAEQLCEAFGVESITKLPFDKVNEALAWIQKPLEEGEREPGADDEA